MYGIRIQDSQYTDPLVTGIYCGSCDPQFSDRPVATWKEESSCTMALHGTAKSVLRLLPRIILNLLPLLLIPEQISNLHAPPLLAMTPTMPAIVVLGNTKLSHHCAAEGRIY